MELHTKSIFISLTKYFLLALAFSFPVAMIMLDVLWLGNNVGEHSFTEYSQSLTLMLIIGTFSYITIKHKDQRAFTYMAIGLFVAMLIREQNFYFNRISPHLWESLVAVTFVIAFLLSYKSQQLFAKTFSVYLKSRAGHLMAIGLILLLFYSRFLGMSIIWKAVLQENYTNAFKNIVEEGTELLAYVLILYAAQVYRKQLAEGTHG